MKHRSRSSHGKQGIDKELWSEPVVWIIILLGRGKLVRMNVYIYMCIHISNIFRYTYKYDICVLYILHLSLCALSTKKRKVF